MYFSENVSQFFFCFNYILICISVFAKMEIDTQLNSKRKCTLAKGNHEKCKQVTVDIAYRTMISDDQTKITDMPQLCLEHIFMYLDLEDLLNVVDANKYLRLAAQTPFSRKYTGREILI